MLKDAVFRTARTASMILVLVAASNFFGAVFSRLGTPTYIAEWLLTFDLPPIVFLLVLLLLVFLLGWPLAWVPIVVIILPRSEERLVGKGVSERVNLGGCR